MRYATHCMTCIALTALAALIVPAAPAHAQLAQAWMVVAAANNDGFQGTFWSTDLSIHNPHEYDLPIVIQALPSGRTNLQVPTITLTLFPWETYNLWNAFGPEALDVVGTGAILVYADVDSGLSCNPAASCHLLVTSRTFTPEPWPGEGEYGQTIPGQSINDGIDWWTFGYLAGILNDGQWFRTNVGVASWTPEWITVRIDIQDSAGNVVGNQDLSVPPYGHIQRRLSTELSGGSLVFYLIDGPTDALVYPYASVVNELTGDPSFFAATPSEVGVTVARKGEKQERRLSFPTASESIRQVDHLRERPRRDPR